MLFNPLLLTYKGYIKSGKDIYTIIFKQNYSEYGIYAILYNYSAFLLLNIKLLKCLLVYTNIQIKKTFRMQFSIYPFIYSIHLSVYLMLSQLHSHMHLCLCAHTYTSLPSIIQITIYNVYSIYIIYYHCQYFVCILFLPFSFFVSFFPFLCNEYLCVFLSFKKSTLRF